MAVRRGFFISVMSELYVAINYHVLTYFPRTMLRYSQNKSWIYAVARVVYWWHLPLRYPDWLRMQSISPVFMPQILPELTMMLPFASIQNSLSVDCQQNKNAYCIFLLYGKNVIIPDFSKWI